MPRPLPVHLLPLLISQAAAFNLKLRPTRVCETPSLLLRSSAVSPPPLRYIDDSATSSVVAPRAIQDVVPRSWLSDSQGGHDIQVVANHPSMSLDLTGAECENESAVPVSARSIEAAIRLNKSSSVLDISNCVETPSVHHFRPHHPRHRHRHRPLGDHHFQVRSSPTCPHKSRLARRFYVSTQMSWPLRLHLPRSSRSPVRPLPTPPTTPSTRRPRSAKPRRLTVKATAADWPRSVVSAEDFRSYSQGRRRSRAHSITSVSVEMDGYDIVQHHDGGAHARIDLPPPYHECLQAQATTPTPL
ncbi:hypothetical protein EDB85DRAFT_2045593 [Lactarius pseudohatsudake]|nr:hypothetical protein EDB85DRAFT_2045593 [Lactarius pseudohatsudake]